MPVIVARVYDSPAAADSALKELQRQRFSASDIHVVKPPAAGTDAGEEIVQSIAEGGISKHRAARYAEVVKKGGTLVIVHPPFGNAALVEEVLDHFKPTHTGIPDRDFEDGIDYEDDATPFSRFLGWRVLSRDPAPFSDALGWKTLSDTKTATYPATFGGKMISHNPTPFSSLLGLPVLSRGAAPLSSATGMKTLSHKASPFSDMLGLKTLTPKQTVLGEPKLTSDNPAPFSRALGLPVLTKKQ